MKYGIFSDVHGNLEALNVVLDFLKSKKVDYYLCVGDIVGYGPNPNECVEIISKLHPAKIIVGNHDWASCGLKSLIWFNDYAKRAINWTKKVLTQNNQIYLSELPKSAKVENFTLVHGSPRDPLDEYILEREHYKENLKSLSTKITFVGHTHIPIAFSNEKTYIFKDNVTIHFPKEANNLLINIGSVGQPRDGNFKASCGIFEAKTNELQIHRLEYDIALTQDKMRYARLPSFLIERLSWGK